MLVGDERVELANEQHGAEQAGFADRRHEQRHRIARQHRAADVEDGEAERVCGRVNERAAPGALGTDDERDRSALALALCLEPRRQSRTRRGVDEQVLAGGGLEDERSDRADLRVEAQPSERELDDARRGILIGRASHGRSLPPSEASW